MEVWLIRIAMCIVGAILGLLILKFVRRRPCWFFNHRMKHLAIEKKVWLPLGECERCNLHVVSSYRHDPHIVGAVLTSCYVTKWICEKCDEMGFFCAGDTRLGAWKVEHGSVVPDEKAWAQWDQAKP